MLEPAPTTAKLPEVAAQVPLCVDLDGTLVKTDTFVECVLLLLKKNLLYLFVMPLWLWRGKANFKQEVCRRVDFEVARLPYEPQLLTFLQDAHRAGRPIILATGADRSIAQKIADHLGLFTEVLASDGVTNLTGRRKLAILMQRYGARGFDYAGNARPDVHVWQEANLAIVVNAGARVTRQARALGRVDRVFDDRPNPLRELPRALRVHQWVKNILIFIPLLTSHRLTDFILLGWAAVAFVAFSLCASSVYVLNDCLDLQADRRDDKKRRRPFAAGNLPVSFGMALNIVLLAMAAGISLFLPVMFQLTLGLYYVLTLAYSLYFKRKLLLDVFFLGGLYTIRVLAGNAATGVAFSPWLLAFSMFLFVSLAFVKRVAEFDKQGHEDLLSTSGRSYRLLDKSVLIHLGATSGLMCVLVLALYINSPQVEPLYKTPIVLWLLCPLVMYWISRVWVITCRGKMDGDPVVFALRDGVSYVVGLCAGAVIIVAKAAWPF